MKVIKTCIRFWRLAPALSVFFLLVGVCGLSAGGVQQSRLKTNMTNIGGVHISFDPYYAFGGIEYDTYDRAYRTEIDTIARGNNVNFIHVEAGADSVEPQFAVQALVNLGVNGMVFFDQQPGLAPRLVRIVQAAGVPVIIHSLPPQHPLQVHYVSFDEYGSTEDLGKAVGNRFLQQFPASDAKVLILNSRSSLTNIAREDGFTAGFKSVIPSAQFISRQDTGTIESADDIALASLGQAPSINVIFTTSDLRAEGVMVAVKQLYGPDERANSLILASVGGSNEAMRQLVNPNNPWKAEVGLAIRDFANQSYKLMMGMIKGDIPKDRYKLYLVKSPVFVHPTREQVQQYLMQNHGEQLN